MWTPAPIMASYARSQVQGRSFTSGEANFNGQQGLRIYTKGAVTVTGFYVAGNEGDGYYIDNTFSPTAPAVTLTDVTVPGGRGDGGWYKATDNGINLNIKGPATIKDVIVYDNSLDGIHIVSSGTGAITITNASNTFNETYNNDGNGYYIDTKGLVTVTNLDSHDNVYMGGFIDNSGATSASAVTVNIIGTAGLYQRLLEQRLGR